MTKQDLHAALVLAESQVDLTMHDDSALFGCALPDYKPGQFVTLGALARFIRWQCIHLDGTIDGRELNELGAILKRKVGII